MSVIEKTRIVAVCGVLAALLMLAGCGQKKEETSKSAQSTEENAVDVTTLKSPIKVTMETSMGDIVLELYPDKAPVSVQNFIDYVQADFYDNTIFHRVIEGFMIQGGGFDKEGASKETRDPIENEADNGLKNERGTIAYARTNEVNSATSQFFINHRDNPNLDFRSPTPSGYGYAVFGKVVDGMDVVDKIASVPTTTKNLSIRHQGQLYEQPRQNVPTKPVVIKDVHIDS